MKRLLCIVGSMDAGGAETFLMKVYRALNKEEYQIDFAVSDKGEGFYEKEILSYGGKIHRITPKSHGAFKNMRDIYRLVKKEKYANVLRVSQHSLSAMELLVSRLAGAKITGYRSSNSSVTSGNKKQLLIHKAFKFLPKMAANVRVAPSTEAAEFMFGKNCVKNGKAFLLHNAIDVDYFTFNLKDRNRIRDEFGLNDKFVVGHIGRFNYQKNHKFLLDIFNEISKKRDDAVLVLIGKGELEQDIKDKIDSLNLNDKVIFTGVRSDVPALLSAMDVFIFPSFYEGMPNTVIEAQANGLSCIIADTITKEANITGLVTYLPLTESAETWAEMALSANLTHNNQKEHFIKSRYDIDSVVNDFTDLLFK